MIETTLKEAALLYQELIEKYPSHQFLSQIVFRLELCSVLPKHSHNSMRLFDCLPELFPNKESLLELERSQCLINSSNYHQLVQKIKNI